MFTYTFLVVFSIGDAPHSRIGNGEFGFRTNDPEMKSPTFEAIRGWEQGLREQLDESTVVITSFFPLAS
jgi:hypothetical protein